MRLSDRLNEAPHARLSASGSPRWINCASSPALEDLFDDEDSEYSMEGTLAHSLASACLDDKKDPLDYLFWIQADFDMLEQNRG